LNHDKSFFLDIIRTRCYAQLRATRQVKYEAKYKAQSKISYTSFLWV